MIFVEFDYIHGKDWEAVDWQKVRENMPRDTPEEKPASFPWYGSKDTRLTHDEAVALVGAGLKLIIKPPPGAMTVKMQDREKWDYNIDVKPEHLQDGRAIQIAVPDLALMWIDEVEVQEDFCTHQLQSMLDEGWRILAICPPNAQRRPDYILGRRKERNPFDAR